VEETRRYDVGDADDRMNRVTGIQVPGIGTVAEYAYTRRSRRIAAVLGGVILQTVAAGNGYAGLDPFGRIADLHFRRSSNLSTIHALGAL